MNTTNKPAKLTRAQLRESLNTVPLDTLFSPAVSKELTGKQKRFARDVAMGKTKADAYRNNYNVTSKHTMASKPYALAADERVKVEIEAIKRAIAAQEYQTPAALRALVIQSLVGVITNPDSQPGQITAAAKVLGTVTEVAAFTERKEVRTITSSETARAQVLEQLRTLVQGSAIDVAVIDRDADSLLAELADGGAESVDDLDAAETHPPATPHFDDEESLSCMHTIPDERSPSESIPLERPPSSTNPAASPQDAPQEDPPSGD